MEAWELAAVAALIAAYAAAMYAATWALVERSLRDIPAYVALGMRRHEGGGVVYVRPQGSRSGRGRA